MIIANNRGAEYGSTVEMVLEQCCNCGIPFAMPKNIKNRRLEDRAAFYCPNGHGQHYTGESEAARLKRQLLQTQQRLDQVAADRDCQQRFKQNAQKAAKAATTRARNLKARAAAGVCPCCNRYFADLHSHMSVKHPSELKRANVSPAPSRQLESQ